MLSFPAYGDETRMDSSSCPSTRDDDWVSTTSPCHVPVIEHGKRLRSRTEHFGREITRTAISRLPGDAAPDRIHITAAGRLAP